MSSGNRARANQRIRALIDGMLKNVPDGQTISIDTIRKELAARNRHMSLDHQRLSCLIREREDVICKGRGRWVKVSA
jgi:hypothetical protein